MSDERSHLSVIESNSVKMVEFKDRKILEEIAITEIGDELFKLVADTPSIHILLTFKNVEHLSSAALGMLITLNKKVEEASGLLKLSDITPQIYEVFKITRLNKLFQIYDSTELALAAF